MKIKEWAPVWAFYFLSTLWYFSKADQSECPRVETIFDFQDEEDQTGFKEVTAITHIQGSTLTAVGVKNGYIEIWDYDNRELITKYKGGESLPVSKINHIIQTNFIIIRFKKDDGVAVEVFDMVRQEHICWIARWNSSIDRPGEVVDSFISQNGKHYFLMTPHEVLTCELNDLERDKSSKCTSNAFKKSLIQEGLQFVFGFEVNISKEYYVMSTRNVYKVNLGNYRNYEKMYAAASDITDMIRIEEEGLVVISLSSFDFVSLNLLSDSWSDRAKKLSDYLNYVKKTTLVGVSQMKSFFSESCILILFEIKNLSSKISDSPNNQMVLGYSIIEDKVLFHQEVSSTKLITPITSSRSFLLVDKKDTIQWYVYPLISKKISPLTNQACKGMRPYQWKSQVMGYANTMVLSDNNQGKIVIYDLVKEVEYSNQIDINNSFLVASIQIEETNQVLMFTSDMKLILIQLIKSYGFSEIRSKYLSKFKKEEDDWSTQSFKSIVKREVFLMNFDKNTFVLLLDSYLIFIDINTLDTVNYLSILQIINSSNIFSNLKDNNKMDDITNSIIFKNKLLKTWIVASSVNSLFIFNITQSINLDNNYYFDVKLLNSTMISDTIVAVGYDEYNRAIVTQSQSDKICAYNEFTLQLNYCIKILTQLNEEDKYIYYLNETSSSSSASSCQNANNQLIRRPLKYDNDSQKFITQQSEGRIVIININSKMTEYFSTKWSTFYQSVQISFINDERNLVFFNNVYSPTDIIKQSVALVEYYKKTPVNQFRNMVGIISDSQVNNNELLLQMTNGCFFVLDLQEKVQKYLITPDNVEIRKFTNNNNTLLYLDKYEVNGFTSRLFITPFKEDYSSIEFQKSIKCKKNVYIRSLLLFFVSTLKVKDLVITENSKLKRVGQQNIIALRNLYDITCINFVTGELFPVFRSGDYRIVSTDFNQTLGLIVIGMSNRNISVLNVNNLRQPFIQASIVVPYDLLSVHHSVLFKDRIYFTSNNLILRWDVVNNTYTEVFALEQPLKEVQFILELDAIVAFMQNGIVLFLNDDKSLNYSIDLRGLANAYLSIQSIYYLKKSKNLVFVSDHRIWSLILHDITESAFRTDSSTESLNRLYCTTSFYVESMLGDEYFNKLGKGTISSPYKSVGAMRKETIKIGKSHKVFNYSKIYLQLYLQNGVTHYLQEPFQYSTLDTSSFVTFQTYLPPNKKIDTSSMNQRTQLKIRNGYKFQKIQKLVFTDMAIQVYSVYSSTSAEDIEVNYMSFQDIDQLTFTDCEFYPGKTNSIKKNIMNVFIFKNVQNLYFKNIIIKDFIQFISNQPHSTSLKKLVYLGSNSPSSNIQSAHDSKKCLYYESSLFDSNNNLNTIIDGEEVFQIDEQLQTCKYAYIFPSNNQAFLFIYIVDIKPSESVSDKENSIIEYKDMDFTVSGCTLQNVKLITFLQFTENKDIENPIIPQLYPFLMAIDSQITNSTIFYGIINNSLQTEFLNLNTIQFTNYKIYAQVIINSPHFFKCKLNNVAFVDTERLNVARINNLQIERSELFNLQFNFIYTSNVNISKVKMTDNKFIGSSTNFILFKLGNQFKISNFTLINNDFSNYTFFQYSPYIFTRLVAYNNSEPVFHFQEDSENTSDLDNDIHALSSSFNEEVESQNPQEIKDDWSHLLSSNNKKVMKNEYSIKNTYSKNNTFTQFTFLQFEDENEVSYLVQRNTTFMNSTLIQCKLFILSPDNKHSSILIDNIQFIQLFSLNTYFFIKQQDHSLSIKYINITQSKIIQSNIIQVYRSEDVEHVVTKLGVGSVTLVFKLKIKNSIFSNSKLCQIQNSALFVLSNSFFSHNSFASQDISTQRFTKYFIELDRIKLTQASLIYNTFNGQILIGTLQQNTQFADYILQDLKVNNNIFNAASNSILVETTFSHVSKGSQIFISNFEAQNNVREESKITISAFLVEGSSFFFFHLDKIQTLKILTATLGYNSKIGFGVFKNINSNCSITNLSIVDENMISNTLEFESQYYLMQSQLIIRNAVVFTLENSKFTNLRIYNAPVIEIDANKNIFATQAESIYDQESYQIAQSTITNITFSNNLIELDPYFTLGCLIEYTTTLKTSLVLKDLQFISNVIKGLVMNSPLQAQLQVSAILSDVSIISCQFLNQIDRRNVKTLADQMYISIDVESIEISDSQFIGSSNNQIDESALQAIRFNDQIVGSLSYKTFSLQNCTISSMRSYFLSILELNGMSDQSYTLIENCTVSDILPKYTFIHISLNQLSSTLLILNSQFIHIFGQILQLSQVTFSFIEIAYCKFINTFANSQPSLIQIKDNYGVSGMSIQKNIILTNSTLLEVQLKSYPDQNSIYNRAKDAIVNTNSIITVSNSPIVVFQSNTIDNYNVSKSSALFNFTSVSGIYFTDNIIKRINSQQENTLLFSEIINVNKQTLKYLFTFILNQIKMNNNSILNCTQQSGQLLLFQKVTKIILDNLQFRDNKVNGENCIEVENSYFQMNNNSFVNNYCYHSGLLQINQYNMPSQNKLPSNYVMIIKDSFFSNNVGKQFGALKILSDVNVPLILNNCTISSNYCEQKGGGLYLSVFENSIFQLNNTKIYNNAANERGGGIYISQDIPLTLLDTDVKQLIKGNTSPLTQNICTNGRLLKLKLNDTEYTYFSSEEEPLQIQNQQSGSLLPSIIVQILDQEGQVIIPLHDENKIEIAILSLITSDNPTHFLKGDLEQKFVNELSGFLFENITIYGKSNTTITLQISTSMIEYSGISSTKKLADYFSVPLSVQLRQCQVGEVLFNNNIFESCLACPEKEYSFEDPYIHQLTTCLPCPKNADCQGKNSLSLQPGFWRAQPNSIEIVECVKKANCLGGVSYGDDSCETNLVGPLCEQCNVEQGYINLSSSKCLDCTNLGWTISIMISVLAFSLVYILISTDSTVRRIQHYRSVSKASGTDTVFIASMIVKLFVNYMQVAGVLTSFDLNWNDGAVQGATSIGNPMQTFQSVMDCYLYKIGQRFGITHIYLNFFAGLLIPVGFILVIFIAHYLGNKRNYYYRSYFLKTLFLAIQLFYAPLIFSSGIRLTTCRRVGKSGLFIAANILYSCETTEFMLFSLFVIAPLIFIPCVIVPIFFFISIRSRKKRKASIKTYQYLLGDYKDSRYYWEFVRYASKLCIVMVSVLFLQDIKAKALIISSILLVYATMVYLLQPFKTDILNKLDIFTTLILFVSFNLALIAYGQQKNNMAQWYVAIIILVILNIPTFFWYIYTIFKCYSPWFFRKKRSFQLCLHRNRIYRSSFNPRARAIMNWKLLLYKYQRMKETREKVKSSYNSYSQNSLSHSSISTNIFDYNQELIIHSSSSLMTSNKQSQVNSTRNSEQQTFKNEESPTKQLNLKFLKNQNLGVFSTFADLVNNSIEEKEENSSLDNNNNRIQSQEEKLLKNDSEKEI